MELEDDDESNGHQDQSQVDQDQETTDPAGVGAKGVGSGHGFDDHTSFCRVLARSRGESSGLTSSTFSPDEIKVNVNSKEDGSRKVITSCERPVWRMVCG